MIFLLYRKEVIYSTVWVHFEVTHTADDFTKSRPYTLMPSDKYSSVSWVTIGSSNSLLPAQHQAITLN